MKLFKITANRSIAIILLIMTIVSSNINWGKDNWKKIIKVDGKGYYAYLPAIFIYNDLNFGFFKQIEEEKYYNKYLHFDYRREADGRIYNKYYCGTALAELPFFLLAHLSSYLFDMDMDGYSKPYTVLINIAALFYLLAGLLFLNATLRMYDINEWQRSITLFAAAFGTHLFYYVVGEPGMSHVYSFAFMAMFIFYAHQYFTSFKKKYLLFLAIILGIIVLIRPVNGIVVFVLPFVAGNFSSFTRGIRTLLSSKLWLAFSVLAFLAIVSIQLIIYKISTGHFFLYSYGEEGLNFLSPHFIDILFSYKKGLFLYTPMLFLSLTGLYFFWRSSRYQCFSWIGFFVLITYVFSSWSIWYYGGSFSSRVYVEYIPLFMILLAVSLKKIEKKVFRKLYILLIALLLIVCQIQTYQYRYYDIHWSDMTKEKYWEVFMRVDKLKK